MSTVDVLPLSPPATSPSSRTRPLFLFSSEPTTSTPEDSPASGPESSSLASRKKVEFSPFTSIHHHSAVVKTLLDASGVRPLPPSRECQSYIKSILKSSAHDENQLAGLDGSADDRQSLNEVMESIVQQLSKNDNAESIDAYQTLASTIKAYDEIPEQAVLKNKLTTITRQIRRHLGARERQEDQPADIMLVISALKVLVIMVWNPDFAALLSDDFRSFVLDRSISVIADHAAPKSVLVHYLHLLATQDFRSGLLTSNGRASRLIEALKAVTEHVRGNGVVSERLLVYQRLLDQARPVMKARSTQWVEHMLSAMASNFADTRNKALALGRKACQAFPPSSSISCSMRMALDLKQKNGRTLGMSICRRLEKMVMGKDDAVQVPQIWAVILLLCNNPTMRIDVWQGLKEWLMVIQRCFNGSDTSLRLQANSAWNRFVYIARPHEASNSLVAMLSKPVAAQLERSANDKASKASHAVAISSYCNLLYYAFRPATTMSQYNRVWNEYIVRVMRSSFLERTPGNADAASRILMTLFWDPKKNTKVWNENRAHENRLVEPEELPTIDCKWTRSRCLPILEIFQILFLHSSWGFPGSQDQAYVAKAWRHFLKAIREAASKEIKTSNETRAAIASILEFLTKLWHQQEDLVEDGTSESFHLSKEILTNTSLITVIELGVERVLDLIETEPALYSPSLFVVIFEILKLELASISGSQLLVVRLFSIVKSCLELRYNCRLGNNPVEICELFGAVSQLLFTVSPSAAADAMRTLDLGLALWLRDTDGGFSQSADLGPDKSKRVAAVMQRFVNGFTTALSSVPQSCVGDLDASLAAAFASSHSTIVSAVVEIWNKRFGTSDNLEIGPQLTDAITRLLPFTEILLPSPWAAAGSGEGSVPTPVFETQFESAPEPPAEPLISEFRTKVGKRVVRGLGQDIEQYDQIAERRAEPPVSSRRCHDDSQVKFVTIDSSPPHIAAVESQFHTNHQKEIRDRQRAEPAVTFTDLRSSPRPQSKYSEPRDCGFARKAATMTERPTTPTLLEHNDTMHGHPEPSPTPKSRTLKAFTEVDVPSSPPFVQNITEGAEGGMENVSSPFPNGAEAVDHQLQLELPQRPSTVDVRQEELGLDADELYAPQIDDDGDSHLPESAEGRLDRDLVVTRNEQAQIATAQVGEDSEALADASMYATDYAELPSSPPKWAGTRVTPPQCSSSILNTDELNDLSASQLSNDLDWSTILEGLDTPSTATTSPRLGNNLSPTAEAVIPSPETVSARNVSAERVDKQDDGKVDEPVIPIDQLEAVLSQPKQKKRKRPQSGYAERKKKRRKSSRSQSQSTSSQESSFKREEEEEPLDCIVVDTSSEYPESSSPLRRSEEQADDYVMSQLVEVQEVGSDRALEDAAFEHAEGLPVEGGLRRRGRPRRSQCQIKQEPTGSEHRLDETLQGLSTARKLQRSKNSRRSRTRMSVEVSVEPQPRRAQRTPYVLIPTVEVTAPTGDAAQPSESEEEQASEVVDVEQLQSSPPSVPVQSDVVASLQGVLEQIKTAASGTVDLRAVDELCFQIRFQTQIAAVEQVR